MPALRLSVLAETDITDILEYSETTFGDVARLRYEALLETGLRDLAADPDRLGVTGRDELGLGVRTYHLIHCRDRARTERGPVRRPRHLIVFRVTDPDFVDISRVLHDAVELADHVPEEYRAPTREEDKT